MEFWPTISDGSPVCYFVSLGSFWVKFGLVLFVCFCFNNSLTSLLFFFFVTGSSTILMAMFFRLVASCISIASRLVGGTF